MTLYYLLLVVIVLGLYMLWKSKKSTKNQSDEPSGTTKYADAFFAKDRWTVEQSENLKKGKEDIDDNKN